MTRYETGDVPVRGGSLRVGTWSAGGPARRVVLAVHGITSSHRAWPLVAERVASAPGTLFVAPDLRGRGRSADLPGPYGMAAHAEDLVAVLDRLAPGRPAVVAGHSMGGFVAVALAARRPDLVAGLVLVDGGIPLELPPGWTLAAAAEAGLGPAAARLSMTFADREDYRDFWRAHPAFAEFSAVVRDYVDYDLRPGGPPWRCSCVAEAMYADHAEQFAGGPVDRAWAAVAAPVTFLRASRGLLDEPGGLYPEPAVSRWLAAHPGVHRVEVPGVNHYTITLGAAGAARTAAALTAALDRSARPAVAAPD
jgi:pimeloyl-ACP methyl ester carboxylesterase